MNMRSHTQPIHIKARTQPNLLRNNVRQWWTDYTNPMNSSSKYHQVCRHSVSSYAICMFLFIGNSRKLTRLNSFLSSKSHIYMYFRVSLSLFSTIRLPSFLFKLNHYTRNEGKWQSKMKKKKTKRSESNRIKCEWFSKTLPNKWWEKKTDGNKI